MNALSFSPRLSYARRNSSDVRTGRDRSARFQGHPLQALQVAAKQPIHADFVLFAEVHGVRGADALPAKARGKSTARFGSNDVVWHAEIISYVAGAEAEIVLLGATRGGDGDDRYRIALMAEQLGSPPRNAAVERREAARVVQQFLRCYGTA